MNTYPKTDSSFPSGPLSNKFKCCLSAKLLKYALTLPLSSQRGRNYVRFFFVVEKSVPHLCHFSFPISEIGDEKKLWECLSIRYFNPKIYFVIFSFHIFRGKYVSLNSNCIVTVTKPHLGCNFFSSVAFEYQSILSQGLDKTSQSKWIWKHLEVNIL